MCTIGYNLLAKVLQRPTNPPRAFAPGLTASLLLLLALSAAFAPQVVLAQPDKPTELRIVAEENLITLNWAAVPDTSITRWEYRFKNKERSARAWLTVKVKGSKASTRTTILDKSTTSHGGLHGGVGQYQVRAVNGDGAGPWSDVAEVSIINTDNLAVVFSGSVSLMRRGLASRTYNASVARNASVTYMVAVSQEALPYVVNPLVVTLTSSDTTTARVSPSTLTFTADNAETPQAVTVTGVAVGSVTINHAARFPGLALIDPAGTVSVTVTAAGATVPAKPTGFGATAGPRQVTLAWTDPSDASITGWQYRKRVAPGNYGLWTNIPGATATTTSHTVSGFEASSEYTFQLRALNAGGSGAVSDEATATPTIPDAVGNAPVKPIELRITAVENAITLNWAAVTDTSITRWEYRFKNKERSWRGTFPIRITGSNASTRAYSLDKSTTSHGGLHGGVGQYQVRAVNPDGAGPWSDVAEVSIINTDNLAVVFGGGSVSLTQGLIGSTSTYNAGVARSASATYTVALSEAALPYIVNPVEVTLTSSDTAKVRVSPSTLMFTADNAQTAQTVTLTGVAAGSATIGHAARFPGLALIDPAGTIAVTVTEPATVTVPVPAKPANLRATSGDSGITLAWNDPDDATITAWQYRWKTGIADYGPWTNIPGATATTTMYTVTGLTAGTTHTFQVRAVNTGGSGLASDEVVIFPPASPVGVDITAGGRQVTLSWDSANNASITAWQYQQKAGDGDYGAWTNIPDATAATTEYTITGLSSGTEYTFKLRAVNPAGNGPESHELKATPNDWIVIAEVDDGPRLRDDTAGETAVTVSLRLGVGAPEDGFAITVSLVPGSSATAATSCTDPSPVDADICYPDGTTVTLDEDETTASWIFRIRGDTTPEGEESLNLRFAVADRDDWAPAILALTLTDVVAPDTDTPGADTDAGERQRQVEERVLSRVADTLLSGSVAILSSRIDAATATTPPAATVRLGGQSGLHGALQALQPVLQTGTLQPAQLLGRSAFVLPLAAVAGSSGTPLDSLALWGSGDYRQLSGKLPDPADPDATLDWEGSVTSGWIGADMRLHRQWLTGLALSWSQAPFSTEQGTYDQDSHLFGVHPYLSWSTANGRGQLWLSAGYGWGKLSDEKDTSDSERDSTLASVALGGNLTLLSSDRLLQGGSSQLRIKTQGALAEFDIDGNATTRALSVIARQLRFALEGQHQHALSSGALFSPSVELALRHDHSDATEGNGLEVGGALRYSDPALGLTVEGRGWVLATHREEDRKEWGISGLLRIDPGTDQRGLALSLAPRHGPAQRTDLDRLLDPSATPMATPASGQLGLEAELGYGYGLAERRGVLVPFVGTTLDRISRAYRFGGRLQLGPGLSLNLEGQREEQGQQPIRHNVLLHGALHW